MSLRGLLCALVVTVQGLGFAAAEPSDGKAILDLRLRYETVDDANCAACAGRDAAALTLRARIGYETPAWNGLGFLFDIDQVWSLDGDRYNSTRNGALGYSTVADPETTQLNRLQLVYAPTKAVSFTLGRQRLILGNQRFIGNGGWRQHEQTYDALTLVTTVIPDLTLTYAYIDRVNRVFTDQAPIPATGQAGHFGSDSHVIYASYAGVKGLKLDGYAILLDLSQSGPSPLTATRLSTANWGARAEAKFELSPGATLLLSGEYAHQADYSDNPLDIDLAYWVAEAGVTFKDASATVGYQSLEGDGVVGFSTPLAGLHNFNGWAELFLTTPSNGLDAFYARASYTAAVPALKSITAALAYYDFSAQRTGVALGTEFDAQIEVAIDKNAAMLLKYAGYNGDGATTAAGGWTPAAADKTVAWVVFAYKL